MPPEIREWNGRFPDTPSDPRKLAESVADTRARLHAAKRPVLIGGIELYRAGAERDFLRLAERLGVPVVTTPDAKGCFPMDHPLHMGIHMGPFSAPAIEKRVRDADLVLALGTVLTDVNLGAAKPQVRRERAVWAVGGRVNVSFHTYTEVALRDFVGALGRGKLPRFRGAVVYRDNLNRAKTERADSALRVNDLLLEMNHFLDLHPGYDVFAESGDSLFGGLEVAAARGRSLLLAGLLRVDGVRGARGDRCTDRHAPARARALRRRRFPDDRPRDLARAATRCCADRRAGEQQRLADLSAGLAAPRSARHSAVAVRRAGAGMGWRRISRRNAR